MKQQSDFPPMRDWDDVQRAHDALSSIVLYPRFKELIPDAGQRQMIISALDVLCWVLHHDHNQTFQKNLDTLIQLL